MFGNYKKKNKKREKEIVDIKKPQRPGGGVGLRGMKLPRRLLVKYT